MSCDHPDSSRWPVSGMFLCRKCWKVFLLKTNLVNVDLLCRAKGTAERVTIPPFTLNKQKEGPSSPAGRR